MGDEKTGQGKQKFMSGIMYDIYAIQRKKFVVSICAVLLTSAFSPLFLYFQNADEARFAEIICPIGACLGLGLVLFILCWMIFRADEKAATAAALLVLVIENFALLEKVLLSVFPHLHYWHTVPIILVAAMHLIWILCGLFRGDLSSDVAAVLCIVFGGLIVLNGAMAMPKIINRVRIQHEIFAAKEAEKERSKTSSTGSPNIYLLIFDEYANFPQMETYYQYDNLPLREYLEKNQFNISYTSRNESSSTSVVLTNLFCLDYVVDDSFSAMERRAFREQGMLFKIMQENGYRTRGSFDNPPMEDDFSDNTEMATTISGESMEDLIKQQSIAYPFFQRDIGKHLLTILELEEFMTSPEMIAKSDMMTIAYFTFPHMPFVVDEDGNSIHPSHADDWEDKSYYLGQYKYATKLMIRIIENIIENDPEAVVLLMSDHGARSRSEFTIEMKTNPLNAVYFRGEKLDIEGLSSVNTLRTILNRLLQLDLPMVNVPQYDFRIGEG